MSDIFRRWANRVSEATGAPWAFMLALGIIIVWGVSGPVFGYSDTWQLVINTGTTIVTFLMVFLIQNTQNRDSKALHLKLDELIRGVEGARTHLVDLEEMTDEELDQLQEQFRTIRSHGPVRGEQVDRAQKDQVDSGDRADVLEANSEHRG